MNESKLEVFMDESKFERWKSFAFRMANACYKRRKNPSFAWILATLDQVFEHIKEEDTDCFVSWDKVKLSHDGEPVTEVLCDWFQEVIEYEVWVKPYYFATTKESKQLNRWDNKADFEKYDEIKEAIVSRVCEPVHCCVRAGLDLVGEQSGGVLGFTVGDLKRMYPEGLPEWLTSLFPEDLNQSANTQGVWL